MKVLVIEAGTAWQASLEDQLLKLPDFDLVFVPDTLQASNALLNGEISVDAVLLFGGRHGIKFVRNMRMYERFENLRMVMLSAECSLEKEALSARVDVFLSHWENGLRRKIPLALTGS